MHKVCLYPSAGCCGTSVTVVLVSLRMRVHKVCVTVCVEYG